MNRLIGQFKKENSLRSASLILIVTLTLSNVLGLLRDVFLTRNFSFSDTDIYFAAFRIPDTLFNLFILGAITSAFIPVFSDFIAAKEMEKGYRLTSSLINTALIVMALMVVLFFFLMPSAMRLIVPNFEQSRFDQTVHLSRIMMLSPIFFSVSYLIGGVLNSFKRFLAFAISPLLYNLSIIAGALLAPKFGLNGLAFAVVTGSLFHVLIQLPALVGTGFKYSFVLDFKEAAYLKVLKLMVPRSISLGANQLLYTFYTAIGSSLALGSISAFIYSNNIQTVPVVILGSSFAAALFPTLSRKISEGDEASFSRYLISTMKAIGFLLIPSSVIFILLRAQIIRLILGTGHFTSWDDTKMTALTLGLFSISFLAQGLIPLLIRAFFALKNTKLPMYISLAGVIISLILAYPLAAIFSVAGLALAFSIGSFIQLFLLFYLLARRYPSIWDISLLASFAKTALISILMGFAVRFTAHNVTAIVDMTRFVGVLEQTILSCLAGLIIYLFINIILKSEELKWVARRRVNGAVEPVDIAL